MGATGWRTAHNPVNKEILDFTDHHGMLVWNENRNLERQVIGVATQDSLGSSVRRLGFHDVDGLWVPEKWKGVDPMYLGDAQALVLRDRNHPSVIIWSLCNEGGCMQGDPDGGSVQQRMARDHGCIPWTSGLYSCRLSNDNVVASFPDTSGPHSRKRFSYV